MKTIPLCLNFENLDAVFFDFDGVLVDSVSIKLEAYREIFLPFGSEAVHEITLYHIANGGIDRYRKIKHVLQKFSIPHENLETLANKFSELVKDKVIQARPFQEIIDLALSLKEMKINRFVVSGTPEDELIEIVQKKGWSNIFTKLRGSPSTKVEICNNLILSYNINPSKSIFIGDASTDFHTARECKLWFIGVPF